MKILTPVLCRINKISLGRGGDRPIRICLKEVEKFWHVPKGGVRFWFEVGDKPSAGSHEFSFGIGVYFLHWNCKSLSSTGIDVFEQCWGLQPMARRCGVTDGGGRKSLHVRLLYEE